jgi:hypothetical protein
LLLDTMADLQPPQDNESGNTLKHPEFVEWLQRMLGIARDELHDAQDHMMASAN